MATTREKAMTMTTDRLSLDDASRCLSELAAEVITSGVEKRLTRDGQGDVVLIDARRLEYYRALEAEHERLTLANDAVTGLEQALSGRFVPDAALDAAFGIKTRS